MAYNSAHTGPEIDAAVEMLGQVQSARDATASDLAEVIAVASQVGENTDQVATQAATVSAQTAKVLASATAVEQAHAEVLSASAVAVDAKDAAVLSAGSAQESQASASASGVAASQSQLAAGLSEKISAENAAFTSADRLHVDALAQQVEADSAASQASADSAALSALNAAAIVTGGTAAISSSPGKIPLADAQGKIDSEWIGTDIARADAMQAATDVANDSLAAIEELQGDLIDPSVGGRIVAFQQDGSGPVLRDQNGKVGETVSIRDFGVVFDGVASNTSTLQNAINRCVSLGIATLVVNVSFVNLLSDVDCKGVRLQCSETQFVGIGRLNNNSGIIGGYVAGIAQDEVFKAPIGMLCAKSSAKILYKASATEMWVFAKKARNAGYFRSRILWNSFQVPESVGAQSELWRCAQVQNLAAVYGYKKTATSRVGTWTDLDIPLSSGGTGRPYKVNVTSILSDYIEYAFSGTEVSLGLYQSSGSTTGATVQIDGVTVEIINLQHATASVVLKKYFVATGGAHTLRVTRTAGGGTMYVAGINIAELSGLKPGAEIDTIASGVLGATVGNGADRDYIISGGATDYAFHDGALLAGSVHGGELSDYVNWKIDGTTLDVSAAAVGAIWTAESIVLEQRTNFGWDSVRRFDTRSITDFTLDGGWTFTCQMTARPVGGIDLTQSYTCLTTTNPIFTVVDYPVYIAATMDGSKTPVGRTEYVRQRNSATGDTVESFISLNYKEDSKFGGVHLWRSPGAYWKVYYASVCYGLMKFASLAFTTRKQFS